MSENYWGKNAIELLDSRARVGTTGRLDRPGSQDRAKFS
jgi:hypothetical protein